MVVKACCDISRERFKEIEALLRRVRRRTKPPTVDFLLRTGYSWRFLPHEFPKWQAVLPGLQVEPA